MSPAPDSNDVLIVVDVQRDFCPGGALTVPDGDAIVPLVNELMNLFSCVVFTQDWHTPGHSSFASSYQQKSPFETTELEYGSQVLWPDHCVMGTAGAEFHPELNQTPAQLIIRKGFRKGIDSYSAFFENDHKTRTGLEGYLREREIRRIFFAGLAYDFCVKWSALDARNTGFDVIVVKDASRAIDLDGSEAAAEKEMIKAGVRIVKSTDIGK